MTSTQTVWLGHEPVLAPASARVVHMEDCLLIAVPTWTVRILTRSGHLEPPDDATNKRLLETYFSDLLEQDFENFPN